MDGQIVDQKYRLTRLIGEGGMGCVYEAQQLDTGEQVAVKLISGQKRRESATALGRFQREARAAAGVDTPHIVHVRDAGTDPVTGAPYLVMEYLDGEDLGQLLHRLGPLRPEVALRIIVQACLGLQKAHEARVIHRDIKPANLFLARSGDGEVVVKLLDFGIAKIKPSEGGMTTGLTTTGKMLGSPLFMAPEQIEDIRTVDYRTDIWSLGVVLYAALSGNAPHHHIASIARLFVMICTEPAPPIQDVAPWVPREVAAVVHRALQLNMSDRFQSVTEMLEAMLPLLPDGHALRQELLVTATDSERAVIAPRLDVGAAPHRSILPRAGEASQSDPPRDSGRAGTVSASSGGPLASRTASSASSGRSAAAWSRAPTVLLALGVAGAVVYLAGPRAAAPGGDVSPAASEASTAPAEAAGPASVAPGGALRRVVLAVAPRDAAVEVDGARVEVREGLVEIAGVLGSNHRVRLVSAGVERVGNVVVTENGAFPPTMAIDGAAAGPSGPAAAPSGPAAAPSGPAAAPSGPAAAPSGAPNARPQAPRRPAAEKTPPEAPSPPADPLVPSTFE
ncbi:protein kinase domain-containing protein [Sorangium sp. So ce1182]|uniref:serine/threonine-protein kinase n=1 Tax=Sorangium sp. So ce1182 TaxID=3133334 RepID=UPI003F61200A